MYTDNRAGTEETTDEAACDGVHDDTAPAEYLCTQCFATGADTVDEDNDQYADVRDGEETE